VRISQVNTDSTADPNDVTQMASDLSSLEISYYRRIVSLSRCYAIRRVDMLLIWQISEIIEESYPANSVSSVQALNIAGDLEPSSYQSLQRTA
jgi:hypothetical protein